MLIPIVTRQTDSFCAKCRSRLREGALALGASKWKMIATVVVPAGSKGILTGMILGIARIAGEAAPLLFTALNNQFWGGGIMQPTASLPVMIYYRALSALRRLAPAGLGRRPGADRAGPDRQYFGPSGSGAGDFRTARIGYDNAYEPRTANRIRARYTSTEHGGRRRRPDAPTPVPS